MSEEITSTGTPDRDQVEKGGSTPGPTKSMTSLNETPDFHSAGLKIQRARDAYEAYAGHEDKPTNLEVFCWCFYGLCSYFIHTVLIPVVFPLIISQIASRWPDDDVKLPMESEMSDNGIACSHKEALLYEMLTNRTITVHSTKYSPLEWTAISWATGLAVAAPLLGLLSIPLDSGPYQAAIALAATSIGAVFCLPAGFFRTVWIFIPYITVITAASTVPSAYHTRHLGLMVHGFTAYGAPYPVRRAASGWLSLAATATGSLGAAIMSAFTYYMLKEKEVLMTLWIVSIFSGLKWLLGSLHFLTSNRSFSDTISTPNCHTFSILKYPHALGSLISVFLSSLSTMSIFAGTILFLVGEHCFKPKSLLHFWLTYFLFPLISLPMLHPIQHLLKINSVKMQILGFFVTATISGLGFAFRFETWETSQVLFFTAIQGTANGVLHAYGRVLLVDCSPRGKEGAFSSWFVWVKVAGTCVGFAIASATPGNVAVSFGLSFCVAIGAVVVLIFGNVSDVGGAVHAGHARGELYQRHVMEKNGDHKRGSPVHGVDSVEAKEPIQATP